MQKVIRIVDDNTTMLDVYLNAGWVVKQMAACRIDRSLSDSVCYILIEKLENNEEQN